ncbi:serine/threonine-protein kinase [Kutzneria sp. CA-103260]|uniref:serine/threonine-protein kinase n=1 Tax=Kutzneria sp. CA-103260 TaxID=2802641 RepID=UPI001BA72096|nr:serine/threonine-protein kinase [Kutzneria sp. CA-103260]QUQ66004.1 Serine/threonine-protein kinase PknD [Kutzneria sp. CA-103260]
MGGEVLLAGRYRVGALIGRGAMAEVCRAYDMRLERPVAIKRFTAGGDLNRLRFEEEARVLARLNHPGLVTLYEAGEVDGARYLVMELVNGPSLLAALEREKPTLDEVLALGRQLLPTLAYVHGRGVVHRDVKPSNILVDLDGEAFLADFGLARLVETAGITRSGEIVGTAAYLAPEQVRGEAATTAVDVYALGLVLLQCLTGRQEFPGTQSESALARLTRDPVIPDDLPVSLAELLAEMTHADPECRPAAADCALRWEAIDTALPVPRRKSKPRGKSRPRRKAWLVAAGIASALTTWLSVATSLDDPSDAGPARHTAPPTSAPATPTSGPTTVTTSVGLAAGTANPPDDPTSKAKHSKKPKPSKHK